LPYSLVSDYLAGHKAMLPFLHSVPLFCYAMLFITHLKAIQCSQHQP
jgi:hypothetical protein